MMNANDLARVLYGSPISVTVREVRWLIPTVQSLHIVAIAVVVGSALVTDLRLAGVMATDESPRTVVKRYQPWMWAALAVLLVTGIIMCVGEPNRVLANGVFWTKMAMVAVALVLTLLFRYPILHPEFQLEHARWASQAKLLAWASLAVWIAVIFCGRWIAYAI